MTNEIEEALKKHQQNWTPAKENPRKSEQLPAGTYIWKITNAFVATAQTSGRLQLRIDITAIEAPTEEAKGRNYFKAWGLETEETLKWLTGDLINLGIELPDQMKDLATKTCSELMGICFEGNLRPARDSQYGPNVWIAAKARRTESGEIDDRF